MNRRSWKEPGWRKNAEGSEWNRQRGNNSWNQSPWIEPPWSESGRFDEQYYDGESSNNRRWNNFQRRGNGSRNFDDSQFSSRPYGDSNPYQQTFRNSFQNPSSRGNQPFTRENENPSSEDAHAVEMKEIAKKLKAKLMSMEKDSNRFTKLLPHEIEPQGIPEERTLQLEPDELKLTCEDLKDIGRVKSKSPASEPSSDTPRRISHVPKLRPSLPSAATTEKLSLEVSDVVPISQVFQSDTTDEQKDNAHKLFSIMMKMPKEQLIQACENPKAFPNIDKRLAMLTEQSKVSLFEETRKEAEDKWQQFFVGRQGCEDMTPDLAVDLASLPELVVQKLFQVCLNHNAEVSENLIQSSEESGQMSLAKMKKEKDETCTSSMHLPLSTKSASPVHTPTLSSSVSQLKEAKLQDILLPVDLPNPSESPKLLVLGKQIKESKLGQLKDKLLTPPIEPKKHENPKLLTLAERLQVIKEMTEPTCSKPSINTATSKPSKRKPPDCVRGHLEDNIVTTASFLTTPDVTKPSIPVDNFFKEKMKDVSKVISSLISTAENKTKMKSKATQADGVSKVSQRIQTDFSQYKRSRASQTWSVHKVCQLVQTDTHLKKTIETQTTLMDTNEQTTQTESHWKKERSNDSVLLVDGESQCEVSTISLSTQTERREQASKTTQTVEPCSVTKKFGSTQTHILMSELNIYGAEIPFPAEADDPAALFAEVNKIDEVVHRCQQRKMSLIMKAVTTMQNKTGVSLLTQLLNSLAPSTSSATRGVPRPDTAEVRKKVKPSKRIEINATRHKKAEEHPKGKKSDKKETESKQSGSLTNVDKPRSLLPKDEQYVENWVKSQNIMNSQEKRQTEGQQAQHKESAAPRQLTEGVIRSEYEGKQKVIQCTLSKGKVSSRRSESEAKSQLSMKSEKRKKPTKPIKKAIKRLEPSKKSNERESRPVTPASSVTSWSQETGMVEKITQFSKKKKPVDKKRKKRNVYKDWYSDSDTPTETEGAPTDSNIMKPDFKLTKNKNQDVDSEAKKEDLAKPNKVKTDKIVVPSHDQSSKEGRKRNIDSDEDTQHSLKKRKLSHVEIESRCKKRKSDAVKAPSDKKVQKSDVTVDDDAPQGEETSKRRSSAASSSVESKHDEVKVRPCYVKLTNLNLAPWKSYKFLNNEVVAVEDEDLCLSPSQDMEARESAISGEESFSKETVCDDEPAELSTPELFNNDAELASEKSPNEDMSGVELANEDLPKDTNELPNGIVLTEEVPNEVVPKEVIPNEVVPNEVVPTKEQEHSEVPLPRTGIHRNSFTGHTGAILDIKICGSEVMAACEDKLVHCYSMKDSIHKHTYADHEAKVTSVAVWSNGTDKNESLVVTGSYDGYVRAFNVKTCKMLRKSAYLQSSVQCVEIAWGMVFVGLLKGSIARLCLNTLESLDEQVEVSEHSVLSLKCLSEGPRRILLVATRSSAVMVRDAITGLLLRSVSEGFQGTVYSMVTNVNIVYLGCASKILPYFDFHTGVYLGEVECGSGVVSLKVVGGFLFAACYDGNVYIFRCQDHEGVGIIPGPGRMLVAMDIYKKKKIVVSCSDGTLTALSIPKKIRNEMNGAS